MLIYSHDGVDEVKYIEGIPVAEETKYLDIGITSKQNMFREQRKSMMKKAQKMANMTYGAISKSWNKVMIGKTFWKNIALSWILYGVNVITLTEKEISQLQVIENGVYRRILGAPRYAPNFTLRGGN